MIFPLERKNGKHAYIFNVNLLIEKKIERGKIDQFPETLIWSSDYLECYIYFTKYLDKYFHEHWW